MVPVGVLSSPFVPHDTWEERHSISMLRRYTTSTLERLDPIAFQPSNDRMARRRLRKPTGSVFMAKRTRTLPPTSMNSIDGLALQPGRLRDFRNA
jgi:hypothetical protein